MKRFYLQRDVDESGISGVGRVVDGVLFRNGWVAYTWVSPYTTLTVSSSMENFIALHIDGHPNCAKIVWVDEEHEPKEGVVDPPSKEDIEIS